MIGVRPGDTVQIRIRPSGGGLPSWVDAEFVMECLEDIAVVYRGKQISVPANDFRIPRERLKKERHQNPFKSNPERNEPYLAFIRNKPCLGCGQPGPSDPHHFGPRGIATKTSDFRTVPLCRKCHDDFHRTGLLHGEPTRVETERCIYRKQLDQLIEWNRKCEIEK